MAGETQYLNEDELQRAKDCCYNIEDKMNAVHNELFSQGNAYKSYLAEKLDSIQWDLNVLKNMCN